LFVAVAAAAAAAAVAEMAFPAAPAELLNMSETVANEEPFFPEIL
jgi:hypothetical protein